MAHLLQRSAVSGTAHGQVQQCGSVRPCCSSSAPSGRQTSRPVAAPSRSARAAIQQGLISTSALVSNAPKPRRRQSKYQSGGRLAAAAVAAFAEQDATVASSDGSSDTAAAAEAMPAAEPSAPAADAEQTALSPEGAVGETAAQTVPAAEPSSLSIEPEQAAAEAAEQVEQVAADAAEAGADGKAQPAADPAAAASASSASSGRAPQQQQGPKPGRAAGRGSLGHVRRRDDDKRPQQQHDKGEPIPEGELWFRRGDVVAGRVLWANSRGARIATLRDPRIVGYMPVKEGGFTIKDEKAEDGPSQEGNWSEPCLPVGSIREFQVLTIPDDIAYNGRGPLMSARLVDLDMLWTRAEQALRMCKDGRETMRVEFTQMNVGGMMTRFLGLRLFMPLSHVYKEDRSVFIDEEGLREKYVNGSSLTEVAITEVDVYGRRFVCSEALALEHASVRAIRQGALVWGTVRRVEDYGAFIGLDGTQMSGLLHVSNISREHVGFPDDVLAVGDKVRSVVLAVEEDWRRISLSTAELEAKSGDMLTSPELVYEGAEEQVKYYLDAVEAEQSAAYDQEYSDRDSDRDSGKAAPASGNW